jgi:type IV secretory pathway VirB10-like protein
MNRLTGWAALSLALVLVLGGCSGKQSGEGADQASPPAQEQSVQPGPAQQDVPAAEPETVSQPGKQEPSAATAPPAPAPQPRAETPRMPETMAVAKAEPTPEVAAQPAATVPAAPQEPPSTESRKAVPKDVVILTGSPLGGVRFEHKLHVARSGNNCVTCHHPSRPEKAASGPQQACSDCHTNAATAPMKTKRQAAFHNPTAQSGLCIDCHKAENAKGKKAPLTCMECHKQENK